MPLYDNDPDVHVSSYPWSSTLWRKSKVQRRAMMARCRVKYPVAVYVLAAVEVQRFWRGVLLRRRVLAKYLHRSFCRSWVAEEASVVECYRKAPRAPECAFVDLARRLQARWRTALIRKEYSRWASYELWPIYYVAAATVQRAWVDFQFLKRKKKLKNRSRRFYRTREDAAAGRIQLSWQGYINRSIFQFYVQLIRFREKGDPRLMLRCINPSEAYLMDPAAGLHVRFRLGGTRFPPVILYRIFTHNNVADICSFAPKDYTEARKHATPAMLHNTTVAPPPVDKSHWYIRDDNNPWRPITDELLLQAGEDSNFAPTPPHILCVRRSAAAVSSAPSTEFHYNRAKRREVRQLEAKKKRRKWLAELYTSEQVRQPHQTRSAATILADAEQLFGAMADAEVEEEVSKLTAWTTHLDYDTYRRDWIALAMTAPTDVNLPPPQNESSRPAGTATA